MILPPQPLGLLPSSVPVFPPTPTFGRGLKNAASVFRFERRFTEKDRSSPGQRKANRSRIRSDCNRSAPKPPLQELDFIRYSKPSTMMLKTSLRAGVAKASARVSPRRPSLPPCLTTLVPLGMHAGASIRTWCRSALRTLQPQQHLSIHLPHRRPSCPRPSSSMAPTAQSTWCASQDCSHRIQWDLVSRRFAY